MFLCTLTPLKLLSNLLYLLSNQSKKETELLKDNSRFVFIYQICILTTNLWFSFCVLQIQINFFSFSLAKPNDCVNNFIDVFTNRTDLPSRSHNLCGSAGDWFSLKGHVAFVRFFAKPNANESSFKALYTAYRDVDKQTFSK